MTSSMTTSLVDMKRERDILKADGTQLTINIDPVKDKIRQLKAENDKQQNEIIRLTTLLDKMAINHEKQMQQINSQSSENVQLKGEYELIKNENTQLKIEAQQLQVS